jgi:murein DD-endopeptidase MepM/ murein hydrolase activator NlpD
MTFPQHGRRRAATPARYRRAAAPAAPAASAAQYEPRPRSVAEPVTVRTAPAARKRSILRAALPVLAMTFAGGIALATSVPALAVTATDTEARASVYAPADTIGSLEGQTLEVGPDVAVAPVASESWDVEAAPPPITSSVAGLGSVAIIETGTIVWPVVDHSRMSDVFGPRLSGCSGCSAFHDGIDFLPGVGSPILSIADGVVVTATSDSGGLGNYVEVQHNIGGELLTTVYGHMLDGSMQVSVGDRVTAGQQLGAVGSTGQSTGPHLHFEMYGTDGVRFDGFAWLSDHVNA